MPEPRPDLAAIHERLNETLADQSWRWARRPVMEAMMADVAALLARVEELEAALRRIERMAATWLNDPIGEGPKDLLEASRLLIAIRDAALAAAQEEPR